MEEKHLTFFGGTTQRLYYQDSHRSEFTANVLSCEKGKKGYQVVLDCTAFFPEGGGQDGDIGWLNDIPVTDTREKDGVIYHIVGEPLDVGQRVAGRLDFEERFSRMQQHSGEHIVSGIVHQMYGYDNVGFHLGADVTTLDFNGVLSEEQVRQVEIRANRAVFANLPVEILYPTKEELEKMEYRSKIDIEGQVRIVSIPGVDICACCAPHVNFTGEIGLIKLLSCEHHRGGCRVSMAAGMRALMDYQVKQRSVAEVSVALSARPDQIGQAVLRLMEQQARQKEKCNELQAAYLKLRLEAIAPDAENVCIFEEDMDNIALRNFVNEAMERCSGICGAFMGTDEGGYRYILGSRTVNLREFAKELNSRFQGKGGGKPEMVQGSLTGARAEIAQMIEEYSFR